jgi:hypothetical protein
MAAVQRQREHSAAAAAAAVTSDGLRVYMHPYLYAVRRVKPQEPTNWRILEEISHYGKPDAIIIYTAGDFAAAPTLTFGCTMTVVALECPRYGRVTFAMFMSAQGRRPRKFV